MPAPPQEPALPSGLYVEVPGVDDDPELDDAEPEYAQTLVDASVATLLIMLEAFELESSDHEAAWPMAVTGLVRGARDNAARFQMDSPFASGVLATWSY